MSVDQGPSKPCLSASHSTRPQMSGSIGSSASARARRSSAVEPRAAARNPSTHRRHVSDSPRERLSYGTHDKDDDFFDSRVKNGRWRQWAEESPGTSGDGRDGAREAQLLKTLDAMSLSGKWSDSLPSLASLTSPPCSAFEASGASFPSLAADECALCEFQWEDISRVSRPSSDDVLDGVLNLVVNNSRLNKYIVKEGRESLWRFIASCLLLAEFGVRENIRIDSRLRQRILGQCDQIVGICFNAYSPCLECYRRHAGHWFGFENATSHGPLTGRAHVLGRAKMMIRGIIDTVIAEANVHRSIARIHGEARSEFYRQTLAIDDMVSHSTCLSCLNGLPTLCLPCGHIICGHCARVFGQAVDGEFLLLNECPLSKYHDEWSSWILSQMPRQARPRILSLDGGDVGINVQAEIVSRVEHFLGGLSLGDFFDLIVGTSARNVIACGLGAPGSPVPFKVAITALQTNGQIVVFANYNRKTSDNELHALQRRPCRAERKYNSEKSVWTAPDYFPPLDDQGKDQVFLDGGAFHHNPIRVAKSEMTKIWPETAASRPDIVLSIGTGYFEPASAETKQDSAEEALPTRTRKGADPRGYLALMRDGLKEEVNAGFGSERIWNDWVQSRGEPSAGLSGRCRRLNVQLDRSILEHNKRPDQLLGLCRRMIYERNDELRNLADMLIASAFYYEFQSDDLIVAKTKAFTCKGTIKCRLLPASIELLGKHLENLCSPDFRPFFYVGETHGESRKVGVYFDDKIIGVMKTTGKFNLPLDVNVSHILAETELRLVLRSSKGVDMSPLISAFPRALFEDGGSR